MKRTECALDFAFFKEWENYEKFLRELKICVPSAYS